MADDLPEYYFRIRENGAAVFRLEPENRQRRLEMEQIAVANAKNGEIKPHGNRDLTSGDMAAIRAWLDQRQALLAGRELDEIRRTVEQINLAAQWAQSKASDDALEELTEPLLMAMHDLRSVLVRKKADRLMAKGGGE